MLYVLRHIASVLLLPFTVTVVVPIWLLRRGGTLGWGADASPVRLLTIAVGAASVVLGLTLVVSTVRHFARVGRGTLAPWDPPRELVVEGVYRYVRNPMISGVLFVLSSEVLVTGSRALVGWLGLFFVINLVYIPLLEEPGLARRFGERYRTYRKNVPRWIPRRSPWNPPWGECEAVKQSGRTGASSK